MNIVHRVLNNRQNSRHNFGSIVVVVESVDQLGESGGERMHFAVAQVTGGGKNPGGSGRGKRTGHPAAHKGGEKGGKAAGSRSAAERSASAKKAAATRKRNAEHHAHH